MPDIVGGMGILAARDLRARTNTAINQSRLLIDLINSIRTGGGALRYFEQRALGGQQLGDTQRAQLAEEEVASRQRIAEMFQERGLLGSGQELNAQRLSAVDFSRARAQAAAAIQRERLGLETQLTFQTLGGAAGFTGSQSPAGFLAPSLLQQQQSRQQGSGFGGVLGQIGGGIVGNLLFPATGGGLFSNIFSGFGKSSQPTTGVSTFNAPQNFSFGSFQNAAYNQKGY